MNNLPKPSDRIIEIREHRLGKLLARYRVSSRVLEFNRRGRVHRIKFDEMLDTSNEIVYTKDADE